MKHNYSLIETYIPSFKKELEQVKQKYDKIYTPDAHVETIFKDIFILNARNERVAFLNIVDIEFVSYSTLTLKVHRKEDIPYILSGIKFIIKGMSYCVSNFSIEFNLNNKEGKKIIKKRINEIFNNAFIQFKNFRQKFNQSIEFLPKDLKFKLKKNFQNIYVEYLNNLKELYNDKMYDIDNNIKRILNQKELKKFKQVLKGEKTRLKRRYHSSADLSTKYPKEFKQK